MRKLSVGRAAKADGPSGHVSNKIMKRMKARSERRRAKADPEAPPAYGRHIGWVS